MPCLSEVALFIIIGALFIILGALFIILGVLFIILGALFISCNEVECHTCGMHPCQDIASF